MAERIQKFLAEKGLGSRREIEKWILAGRIKLNGVLATLGMRVEVGDELCLDDRAINTAPIAKRVRILLYHKPVGQICSRHDPEGRPTIFEHLPKLIAERWISVGRLDFNTSGLLLLTTDGELADRLMHPRYGLEREYRVRVYGQVTEAILEALQTEVILSDGPAAFKRIMPGMATGRNQWFNVVLAEGRNREVRRLWESQGLVVNRLERVRFGPIVLPEDLLPSRSFELNAAEERVLFKAIKD